VKWDGFRALVSTEERLLVRSRRGWDMTDRLPDLADHVLAFARSP
jgi:ATP-dependent DNA ligase